MGFQSIIESYYTLPAPGRYRVTVKKGSFSFVTELMVNENSVIQWQTSILYERKDLDPLALSND